MAKLKNQLGAFLLQQKARDKQRQKEQSKMDLLDKQKNANKNKSNKNKIQKGHQHQEQQQQREEIALKRIPYSAKDQLLLIGEANFSFALALARLLYAPRVDDEDAEEDVESMDEGNLEIYGMSSINLDASAHVTQWRSSRPPSQPPPGIGRDRSPPPPSTPGKSPCKSIPMLLGTCNHWRRNSKVGCGSSLVWTVPGWRNPLANNTDPRSPLCSTRLCFSFRTSASASRTSIGIFSPTRR